MDFPLLVSCYYRSVKVQLILLLNLIAAAECFAKKERACKMVLYEIAMHIGSQYVFTLPFPLFNPHLSECDFYSCTQAWPPFRLTDAASPASRHKPPGKPAVLGAAHHSQAHPFRHRFLETSSVLKMLLWVAGWKKHAAWSDFRGRVCSLSVLSHAQGYNLKEKQVYKSRPP